MKTKNIIYTGLLSSLALIFSYIEFLIPIPVPIPGIKLGLANGVILNALYLLGPVEAFLVGLIRIILSFLLFGNIYSLLFSVGGFLLSFACMYLLKRTGFFSTISISISGAVIHNFGQILVACLVTRVFSVFTYLPVLTCTAFLTGSLIGLLSKLILERIVKYDRIS